MIKRIITPMQPQDITIKQTKPQMLKSYMLLRRVIGALAILLPIVLAIGGKYYGGCEGVENSISDYYHTPMRDIFVGTLCAVAMFLFAYRAHDWKDTATALFACLSALGVAFFPTGLKTVSKCATKCFEYPELTGKIHLACALAFFIALIIFSLWLFKEPRDISETQTSQMKKRNIVYKICGWTMLICVTLIILYFWKLRDILNIQKCSPVFYLEFVALIAFGFSWLTKGQLFFKDKN